MYIQFSDNDKIIFEQKLGPANIMWNNYFHDLLKCMVKLFIIILDKVYPNRYSN